MVSRFFMTLTLLLSLTAPHITLSSILFHSFFSILFYLCLQRRKGREEERERNFNVWLTLTHPPSGDLFHNPGMYPDRELNNDPLVHRPAFNSLSHASQVLSTVYIPATPDFLQFSESLYRYFIGLYGYYSICLDCLFPYLSHGQLLLIPYICGLQMFLSLWGENIEHKFSIQAYLFNCKLYIVLLCRTIMHIMKCTQI